MARMRGEMVRCVVLRVVLGSAMLMKVGMLVMRHLLRVVAKFITAIGRLGHGHCRGVWKRVRDSVFETFRGL